MNYELLMNPTNPDHEGWKQKQQDIMVSDANWRRLATLVMADLYHEAGFYDDLSKGLQAELNRYEQLALDPSLPLTRGEIRERESGHESGFPIWGLPIIIGVAAISPILQGLESLSRSGIKGSQPLANRFDRQERRSRLASAMRNERRYAKVSSLNPQSRAAQRAMILSSEPADFIITMDDLLEANEAIAQQDNTDESLLSWRELRVTTEDPISPRSLEQQRALAAEVFMNSGILQNGELSSICLERRADFLPDGPKTFRIHTSSPYEYLYESSPPTAEDYGKEKPWFALRVDPNPVDELLEASRV